MKDHPLVEMYVGSTKSHTESEHRIDKEEQILGNSLVHIIFHGPIFAGIFAFSYVVGYFYGINITLYSLFSVTEQIVFALQALPIALGGSVLFLLLVSMSHKKDWKVRFDFLFKIISVMWIGVLLHATYQFHLINSFGGPFCFFALIATVFFFQFIYWPAERFAHMLYLGINLAVMCLLVGFHTANYHKFNPILLSVIFKEDGSSNEKVITGQVLFFGNSGLLIDPTEPKGQITLFRKKEIVRVSIPK